MKYKIIFSLFVGASLIVYLLTLRGVAGNVVNIKDLYRLNNATYPFESSHERATYSQNIALLYNKQFDLPKELADFSTPDVGYLKGKFYSYFPPGVSLLILPLFILGNSLGFNQLFSYATIPLISTISLCFIYLICRKIFKLPFGISLFCLLTYAFSTTSWSYSITLYQHIIAVYLITSSYYFVWKLRHSTSPLKIMYALLACFNFGVSVFFDFPNLILLMPTGLYFLLSTVSYRYSSTSLSLLINKALIIGFVALIIPLSWFALYNNASYGNWKMMVNNLPRYQIFNLARLQKVTLTSNKYNKQLASTFSEERVPLGIFELLIAYDKGLLVFSPILFLGILGIFTKLKKLNVDNLILLFILLSNIFLYASFGDPWGGWAYGPRYLIPSMAILSIFVGVWLHNAKHNVISRIVALLLFLYSSFTALLGALTTNQVPPKVEADFLHMKYGFLLNWDYFMKGKSSSFAFNEFFSKYISIQQYFAIIYIALAVIAIVLLFIVPRFQTNES